MSVDYNGFQWAEDAFEQWAESDDDQWIQVEDIFSGAEDMPDNKSDIFNRMLEYLPPSFNVDPLKRKAFSIAHATKTVRITVDGFFLRLWIEDTFVPQVNIDLRSLTIQQLVDYLDGLNLGLVLEIFDFGPKSAMRLLDCENDNTGLLWVYTNPIWSLYKAWSLELIDARKTLKEAIRHMSIVGATSYVQDYWGSFADVSRNSDESSPAYGQRILAEIKVPKSNNVALAQIIKRIMGINVEVIDLGLVETSGIMYMNDTGTPMHDSSYPLWDYGSLSYYQPCCFGVVLLNNKTVSDLSADTMTRLRELVYRYKAAGTSPRLIWQGEPKIMYMNDTGTPMHDVIYSLSGTYTTSGGYSILVL